MSHPSSSRRRRRSRVSRGSSSTNIGGSAYNKGDSFTDGAGNTGTVKYDSKTGRELSDPVSSSMPVRSDYSATGADIKLARSEAQTQSFYQGERDRLGVERDQSIADLNKTYAETQAEQATDQNSAFSSRSTALITSGGGALGATQSQEGVLQNLKGTFEREKNALLGKRDSAILAAESAYGDRDFALAKEMMASAKETEKELYRREQDYYSNQVQRMAFSDKQAEAYSIMNDADFSKLSSRQLATADNAYYSGYTKNRRELEIKARNVKTQSDQVGLDRDIISTRLQMPMGKKFTLGGITYTGLKEASSNSDSGKQSDYSGITELISGKLNTLGVPLYTIPGTKGTPFVDETGRFTPEGWSYLYKYKNLRVTPDELIKRYANYFNLDYLQNYKLTPAQEEILTG